MVTAAARRPVRTLRPALPCLAFGPARADSVTALHSFHASANCADGSVSTGAVIERGDSLLGTTPLGEANGFGSVYVQSSQGAYEAVTLFYPSARCSDGAMPASDLALDRGSTLYRTTPAGGANLRGVFVQGRASAVLRGANAPDISLA